MNLEALWTAEFIAEEGTGAGVVIFETGRILGDDSSYYYLGRFEVSSR
jgi:hypothetical protein